MKFTLKQLVRSVSLSILLSNGSSVFADEMAPAHNANLGDTPMVGSETFHAFEGKNGLAKIMDDFMVGLVADPRTKPFFGNNKHAFIKAMLVEQMCELMNGGCKYPGRDMKTEHATMAVNREGFNA